MSALPRAFQATRRVTFSFIGRRAGGPDCVGGGTQVVCRHMRHHPGLPGRKCCIPRRTAHDSGRRHGMTASRSGLRHFDIAASPSAGRFNRLSWSIITGLHAFKMVQHMLGAISRPHCQEVMMRILQRATAPNGNKPRVSFFGEDHKSLPDRYKFYASPSCIAIRCSCAWRIQPIPGLIVHLSHQQG